LHAFAADYDLNITYLSQSMPAFAHRSPSPSVLPVLAALVSASVQTRRASLVPACPFAPRHRVAEERRHGLPTADLHDARLRYPGVQHSLRRCPPQVVHQKALVHSRHAAAAPSQLVEALHRTVIQTSREDQIIRLLALHQFAQHRDQPHAPGPEGNDASLHVFGGVCVQNAARLRSGSRREIAAP
jgi:hypothetical protein